MKKILLLLLCTPLFLAGQINVGNNQTICLGVSAQIIASYTPGTSISLNSSPILITECDPGNPDIIEIQNVSSVPVDVTGWRVVISNSYTDINIANSIEQVLSGIMISEERKTWSDVSTATDYWGNNILWNPGSPPGFGTWIILLDNNDIVMDVFVGNWFSADIASSAIVTTVGAISLSGHWNGDGIDQTNIGSTLQSFSRIGSEDNDDALDFSIMTTSSGITNNGLTLPFAGGGATWYDQNTNQMIGTGDTLNYSPAQSTYILGEIIDTLGQIWVDSMYLEVLNTNISTTGVSLCSGPLILTAQSGFSSYTWNTNSTSQILTVNNPGTYYVDCITSSGITCQSATITIYQDTIPITLSTPDSVFICQGDTIPIDGPTGFTNYNWSAGGGAITVGQGTNSITTTSTGNYSLIVTDGNGCSGTSNTTSVSISPQTITATTTGLSLCNGSVTLDAGSGFSSYQWFNNGLAYFGGTLQTLTVTAAGVYHCEVVYPTGCTAISNSMTIVAGTSAFNVEISAIGSDTICESSNGQVILDAGNYASYLWSNGETTQQITVSAAGSYTVDVMDTSGCAGSTLTPFEVHADQVNTPQISGPTSPTNYTPATYSVTPTFGSTYNWSISPGVGTILTGAGTSTVDVLWDFVGAFTISVTETNVRGCEGQEEMLLCNVILSVVKEISKTKKLKKITDVLGKELIENNNTLLFYIYDDGTVEKKISIE